MIPTSIFISLNQWFYFTGCIADKDTTFMRSLLRVMTSILRIAFFWWVNCINCMNILFSKYLTQSISTIFTLRFILNIFKFNIVMSIFLTYFFFFWFRLVFYSLLLIRILFLAGLLFVYIGMHSSNPTSSNRPLLIFISHFS